MFEKSKANNRFQRASPSLFSYSATKNSSFHDSQVYPASVITDESFGEHVAIDIFIAVKDSLVAIC